jgi:hypothetical protein
MSRAFVKESDGDSEWLGSIAPTVEALAKYLTKEHGVPVVEVRRKQGSDGRELVEMSNGECYYVDEEGRWRLEL